MNRIPFNLEKALAGEPMVNENGKEVSEYHFFESLERGGHKGIGIAIVDGLAYPYTREGVGFVSGDEVNPNFKLYMKPKEVTKWVNVLKDRDGEYYCEMLFNTKEEAQYDVMNEEEALVDTIQVTFTDNTI